MLLSRDTVGARSERNTDADEDETKDPTASFYEQEAFDSIWQALHWSQIRKRVPICLRKSLRSRYLFANLVYLSYTIGILVIDFNPSLAGSSNSGGSSIDDATNVTTTTTNSILDQPAGNSPYVNRLYVGTLFSS